MIDQITVGASTVLGSLLVGTALSRWYFAPLPTGRRRRVPAGVVHQAFRHCPACGVETAAVVHADGSHTCTEGHTSRTEDSR